MIRNIIDSTLNEDVSYQSKPLDLRNQRTYAIKVGERCTVMVLCLSDTGWCE
jgi:hypothetical protein